VWRGFLPDAMSYKTQMADLVETQQSRLNPEKRDLG
jgi:hypothetical protein